MNRPSGTLLLLVAVAASACAPTLGWKWSALEGMKAPSVSEYENHAAVYLLKERRILMVSRWRSQSYTQLQQHGILAILTERGFKHANIRVRYDDDGEILKFAARTIGPDGSATDVEPTDVYDDEAKEDEGGDKIRVFTFPDVQVGSIIEYQFTIEVPFVSGYLGEFVTDKLPIKKYRLLLEGTKDIRYAVRGYNTQKEWGQDASGDLWRLTWEMDDVPATITDEGYPPLRAKRDPRWAFRIAQFVRGSAVANFYNNWDSALQLRAANLYVENDEYYEGFEANVDFAGCKEVVCKVGRALDYLTKELPFRGSDGWPGKNARTVVEQAEASDAEKTRLLWWILKEAGIESMFAFTDYYLENTVDKDFPVPQTLSALILWIPPQDGLEEGFWTDPACEHCPVKTLPYWLNETEALLVSATKGLLDKRSKAKTEFRPVKGKLIADERDDWAYRVKLAESGDAAVTLVHSGRGNPTRHRRKRRRKWTQEDWKKDAEEMVKDRAPTGQLQSHTKDKPEGDIVTRTIEFLVPQYATRDGAHLLVPLSVVKNAWDDKFEGEETRTLDLVFQAPFEDKDIIFVEAPAGHAIESLPKNVQVSNNCLDIEIKAVEESPTLAKIIRHIKAKPGLHPKTVYPEVRKSLATFSSLRQALVTFKQTGSPAGASKP